MRFIISLLVAGFAFSATAKEVPDYIRGTVTDIVCAEMDPFAVGDACVVFATERLTGNKIGLVFHDYDWYSFHIPEPDGANDWVGEEFEVSACEQIKDPNQISVLKRYNSNFFYISCSPYEFNWWYRDIDEP